MSPNKKKGMYRGYYILMGIIAILPWIIAIPSCPSCLIMYLSIQTLMETSPTMLVNTPC